jgi:hypothetical protein
MVNLIHRKVRFFCAKSSASLGSNELFGQVGARNYPLKAVRAIYEAPISKSRHRRSRRRETFPTVRDEK